MQQLSEEQVVEKGSRAESLLNSDTFRFVVDMLSDGYTNNILESKPNERQLREENYHLHKALSDLVAQLAAFVTAKDEIIKRREEEQEEKQNDE